MAAWASHVEVRRVGIQGDMQRTACAVVACHMGREARKGAGNHQGGREACYAAAAAAAAASERL